MFTVLYNRTSSSISSSSSASRLTWYATVPTFTTIHQHAPLRYQAQAELTHHLDLYCQAKDHRRVGVGSQAAEADPRGYVIHMWLCYGTQRNSLANQTIGKILKDEDTVESYKIDEKGFVVCVMNRVNTLATYD